MTRRQRLRQAVWLVAPLLLVAVAGRHVALRTASDLTPWKGGGFGMFSTVDSPGTRLVRVHVRSELGNTEVAVPSSLQGLVNEVKAAPSAARMDALVAALAGQAWVVPRLPFGAEPGAPAGVDQLVVQAMATVLPVDTVRAVSPDAVDPQKQSPVPVSHIDVAVYRLVAEDVGAEHQLRPSVIRQVSIAVPPNLRSAR